MDKRLRHFFLFSVAAFFLLAVFFDNAALAAGHGALPSSFKAAMSKGWAWAYFFVFLGGVGSCLTPCVYPLIAITVSIFVGAEASENKLRSLGLTGMYTLGLAVTMSVLGLVAGLAGGRGMGDHLSSPWVVIPLAALFLVLASSMFGAFELRLPASWNDRLNRIGGAGPWGAFLMGLVGGLIALPCTGPVLAGILAFVGAKGNAVIGLTLLVTYAVGFGVAFWVIATFSMWLPRSGRWMEGVKAFFGVVLVVVSIYFLEIIFPSWRRLASPQWWFFGVSLGLVVAGGLVGAFHLTFHGSTTGQKVRKALGLLLLIAGSVGILHFVMAPKVRIAHRSDVGETLVAAKAEHKPVLMDFWASYCTPCLEMDKKTFGDPKVAKVIRERFEFVKVDCTKDTPKVRALRKKYRALELPTIIILDSNQKQIFHHSGFLSSEKLLEQLAKAK